MWKKRLKFYSSILIAVILFSLLNTALAYGYVPGEREKQAVKNALFYLKKMQNEDGGFPYKKGEESDPATTSWVIIALGAAGEDIQKGWLKGGKSPVDYLKGSSFKPDSTTDYARTLLALTAAGEKPVYKGENLAAKLKSWIDEEGKLGQKDKGEDELINAHIWGILALISSGQEVPDREKARAWLIKRQNPDGSFAWAEGIEGDADDTAAAVQALIALGENKDGAAVRRALAYLKSCQLYSGGFKSGWSISQANSCSDAWVMQALIAAGEDIRGSSWSRGGKNVVEHLLSLQDKSGGFRWREEDREPSIICTAYAVTALSGKCFTGRKNEERGIFYDLSSSHWAYQAVFSLLQKGVVGGYPDHTFRPEKALSRAEFARILCSALQLQPVAPERGKGFKDVPEGYWATSYIETAYAYGYMRGYPDGSFNPEGKIRGSELAAVLCQILKLEKPLSYEGERWYSFYVEEAGKRGLLYPVFEAERDVSRAGCAYSIYQILMYRQEE
ncbi:Prenyltransferase, beta subunit [Thermosyntropha lipolytica DSM 11003]|uniref:Prenyltransferase, beta subunit n=1 Tax=Thermosyntropha lipolytica DSM 11003 TaxID=1123382 RepID=A0A1M5QD23_9FIRM|nr:S-layer homology domain-containing protein [Thermosyntropha lipolytica]SHH11776.1 Prenyltransferase, beta subunit [Thermosyntropha lipolytica DSM 11003]